MSAQELLNDEQIHKEWTAFKANHKKEYLSDEEETKRKEIFKKNYIKINDHNKKFEKGEVSFKMAINKMADLTPEEIPMGHGIRQQ